MEAVDTEALKFAIRFLRVRRETVKAEYARRVRLIEEAEERLVKEYSHSIWGLHKVEG